MGKKHYRFASNLGLGRRLYTIPPADDWSGLTDYYGTARPFVGFSPRPYPGQPMPDADFANMLSIAQSFLGWPYVWGGKQPSQRGFDCTGFVNWVYNQAGLIPDWFVPPYWAALYDYCTRVPAGEEQPGDLAYWYDINGTMAGTIHVAIYIGINDQGVPYGLDSSNGGVDYRPISWHSSARWNGYFRIPDTWPT